MIGVVYIHMYIHLEVVASDSEGRDNCGSYLKHNGTKKGPQSEARDEDRDGLHGQHGHNDAAGTDGGLKLGSNGRADEESGGTVCKRLRNVSSDALDGGRDEPGRELLLFPRSRGGG